MIRPPLQFTYSPLEVDDTLQTASLETRNEALIAYAKQAQGNTVLTVVNTDPEQPQDGLPTVPPELGLPPTFVVHDLLSEERYKWRLGPNYIHLEPGVRQAQVMRVEPA